MIKRLFLWDSLVYTDGKVFGSDEGIKKGLSDGEVLGNIIGNVDLITHGLGVGIELGSFDRFFGGSNDE